MTDNSQMSFRISPSIREAFKSKVEAGGQSITAVLNNLVEQYLKSDGSNTPNSASPDAVEAPSMHSVSHLEVSRNEHRLDSIERLVISMLDNTVLTSRLASIELRLADFINLLEKRLPSVIGHGSEFPGFSSQRASSSQTSDSMPLLLTRVADVESKLANCLESQQMQDQGVRQDLAELKANIKELLANQLDDYNSRLQEVQQSITVHYNENRESLSQLKADLVEQLGQHSTQITELNQVISRLQIEAIAPPSSLPVELKSSTSSEKSVSKAGKAKSSQKRTKALVSQPKNTSTKSSKVASQPDNSKGTVNQTIERPMTSNITDDGDSVVINGERKQLLRSSEAFTVAQQNGYIGDNQQFIKLSERKDLKQAYNQYGLGALPELRGKRGERKAWFYAL